MKHFSFLFGLGLPIRMPVVFFFFEGGDDCFLIIASLVIFCMFGPAKKAISKILRLLRLLKSRSKQHLFHASGTKGSWCFNAFASFCWMFSTSIGSLHVFPGLSMAVKKVAWYQSVSYHGNHV